MRGLNYCINKKIEKEIFGKLKRQMKKKITKNG